MLLVVAGALALTAERLSAGQRTPSAAASDAGDVGDIGSFTGPVIARLEASRPSVQLWIDPLEAGFRADPGVIPVASGSGVPTVIATARPGRQLTAILIADDRPVAVIDGAVVNVGDVLQDGARVTSIRSDRVSIREKNGQWRVITIQSGRR